MNFADVVPMAGQGGQAGCAVALTGECGQGQVVPFGHATETTVFRTCGPDCLTQTITLAGGTLIIEETTSSLYCPGDKCVQRGVYGNPYSLALSGVIVGGTGAYAGASGTVAGTVNVAGADAHIQLSGTLILP